MPIFLVCLVASAEIQQLYQAAPYIKFKQYRSVSRLGLLMLALDFGCLVLTLLNPLTIDQLIN